MNIYIVAVSVLSVGFLLAAKLESWMVARHYAMSLLPCERPRGGPRWLFLFAGTFLDMSYSQNLLPVAVRALVMTSTDCASVKAPAHRVEVRLRCSWHCR